VPSHCADRHALGFPRFAAQALGLHFNAAHALICEVPRLLDLVGMQLLDQTLHAPRVLQRSPQLAPRSAERLELR